MPNFQSLNNLIPTLYYNKPGFIPKFHIPYEARRLGIMTNMVLDFAQLNCAYGSAQTPLNQGVLSLIAAIEYRLGEFRNAAQHYGVNTSDIDRSLSDCKIAHENLRNQVDRLPRSRAEF